MGISIRSTAVHVLKCVMRLSPVPILAALSGCASQPIVKPLPPLAPVVRASPVRAEATARPTDTAGTEPTAVAEFHEQNVAAPPASGPTAPTAANATAQTAGQPGTPTPAPAAAAAGASSAGQVALNSPPPTGVVAPPAAAPPSSAPSPRHDAALISDISDFKNDAELSNRSLSPMIDDSMPVARAASMRVVEQAREQARNKNSTAALQLLSQAISIDPSNAYAYFYLGRVYLAKQNAKQALTFLQRAELGFSDNPQWLAETQAFEGCAYEFSGSTDKAQQAYRSALSAASGNYLAQVGYARVAAYDARAMPTAPAGGIGAASPPAPQSGISGSAATAPQEQAPPNEQAAPEQAAAPEEPATQAKDDEAQQGAAVAPDDPAAPPEQEGANADETKARPDTPSVPDAPAAGGDDSTSAPSSAPSEN